MSNGQALYRFDRREVAVDDAGYLILNNRQPYSIEIASPTLVETFVLWFPQEWAEDARGGQTASADQLLDTAELDRSAPSDFFERYTPHDSIVSPRMRAIRGAFKSKRVIDDGWLEEKMRDLLGAMYATQYRLRRTIAYLPALRVSTREELWRRLNRARDYIHAHLASHVTLQEIARAACLSPFHLLRVFHAAFRETPHEYLTRCRLERAKFLLERTRISMTDICLECGFTSLGSFSALFHRRCGVSPREWRKRAGGVLDENSKIREEYLSSAR